MMTASEDSTCPLSLYSENIQGVSFREFKFGLEKLEEEVKHFKQENEIFENYLNANEPTLIADMDRVLRKAMHIQQTRSTSHYQMQVTSRSFSQFALKGAVESQTTLRSSSRPSEIVTISKGPRVNIAQKTDLVMREIDEIQNQHNRFLKKSKKTKFNIRAEVEELDIRSKEVQEAICAFEKITILDTGSEMSQRIPAEKFVRFMQESLKNAQIALEKMRLRTISSKIQYAKLKAQRTQKIELGESVDVADLEKMEIQRVHMISEIRQKNANLLEVKHMNSKANLLLVNHKNLLEKQRLKKKNLVEVLEETRKKVDVLMAEADVAQDEIFRESKRLSDIKKITNMYETPSIMEYILRKDELYELQKNLNIWRRRQQVQDIGLSTYTNMMCQLVGVKQPRDSWFGERTKKRSRTNLYGLVEEEEEEEEEQFLLESASSDSLFKM